MSRLNFQTRFLIPLSLLIALIVGGGSLVFSILKSAEVVNNLAVEARQQTGFLSQLLGVTEVLVNQQVQGSMKLLQERADALGAPRLGAPVQVKDKTVPELFLGKNPQANHFDLVDGVTRLLGGTATLFVRSGDDFVRISTNVKNSQGERAIGTVLDPKGKAIAAIREGKPFYGVVDILGNPFITGYVPLMEGGKAIGILYVGYKADMQALKETVERTRFLKTGYLAVFDGKGKARMTSSIVSPDQAEQAAQAAPQGWQVFKQEVPDWGFTVMAAYPEREASGEGHAQALPILAGGALGAVVLVLLIILLLRRLVLRPLGGEPEVASSVVNSIAGGNLTIAVPAQAGDSTSVLAAVRRMKDSLAQMISGIDGVARTVVGASGNLVKISDGATQSAGRQSDATATIAASLEEIAVSIRHISDNAQSVNAMAENAGVLAEQGSRAMADVTEEMHRSAQVVNETEALIQDLGASSRQIGEIVNVIDEIAEQTNLLALNAAIEAARAGEQGRGFAVVADEVRHLAERTTDATRKITEMVASIQKQTQNAVEAMGKGSGHVKQSMDKVVESGSRMQAIQDASKKVIDAFHDINHSLKEQSLAIEQISSNVEEVAQMNEQGSVAVKTMADAAHQLEATAGQLMRSVEGFQVR
jgi:methyl-accepting chemotaxis protein